MIDIEAVLEQHLRERAEQARPAPARELLDGYPQTSTTPQPNRTRLWVALAAAAMVAVAVPVVLSDRSRPAVSDAGEAQGPRYRWAANGALLSADSFIIEVDGRTFTPPEDQVEFNSDPSREARTIELRWSDGPTEMRLNLNFATDGASWWVEKLWTYNGLTPGDWIEFATPLFRTPLTEDFEGDIDLTATSDGNTARLVLIGVTMQGFGDLGADGAVLPTTTTMPTLADLAANGLTPAPPLAAGLPVTGRYWTPEDSLVIALAQDHALRDCMTDAGFDYPEYPASHWASLGGWEPDPVMGIRRVSAASTLGYHLVDRVEPANEATAGMSDRDRDAFYAAMTGNQSAPGVPITRPDGSATGIEVQRSGCFAQSDDVVNGITYSQEAYRSDLDAKLGQDSLTMAATDPRVADALVAWRNCVTSAVGGEAAAEHPDELARRYAFEGDAATPGEIEVAVADATCQAQTDLQTIFYSVVTEYDRARLGDAVVDYDAMLRLRVDAVAAARAYLQANNIDVPDLNRPANG